MSRWARYRERWSQIGLRGAALGMAERFRNRLLRIWLPFDRWHVGATYHLRPYKAQVVALANGIGPRVAVEVGCGLGDIIARTTADTRIGVDIDAAAIRAARLIHRRGCRFLAADLVGRPETITTCGITHIDVLLMVNWLHGLPMTTIEGTLRQWQQHVVVRNLLIDIIKTGPGFEHLHSVADCARLGRIETVTPGIDGVRDFVLIRVDDAGH